MKHTDKTHHERKELDEALDEMQVNLVERFYLSCVAMHHSAHAVLAQRIQNVSTHAPRNRMNIATNSVLFLSLISNVRRIYRLKKYMNAVGNDQS